MAETDLISRQAAIEAIRLYEDDEDINLDEVIATVAHLPSAQPEWKKGEWCVTPDGMLVCSNCFENPTNRIIVNGSMIYDMTPIKKKMRFCPNCGADMREGKI